MNTVKCTWDGQDMVTRTLMDDEVHVGDTKGITRLYFLDVASVPTILGDEWYAFVQKFVRVIVRFGHVIDLVVPLGMHSLFSITFFAIRRLLPKREIVLIAALNHEMQPKTYVGLVHLARACFEMSMEIDILVVPSDYVPVRMEKSVKLLLGTSRHVVFEYTKGCPKFSTLVRAYIRRCYRKFGSVAKDRLDFKLTLRQGGDETVKTEEWCDANEEISEFAKVFIDKNGENTSTRYVSILM
jgi:hypothetical protein